MNQVMGAAWPTWDTVEKPRTQWNRVKSQPRVSGYSLSSLKTKLQRAVMRQIFSKAKISLQSRDAGTRDWRWKCDLKLPSLKCMWLWTECLKNGAVSIHDKTPCPSQQLTLLEKVIL